MTIVVDASVAVKWVLPEAGTDAATALRDERQPFAAPSIIVAEVANVLWKRARRSELTADQAQLAIGFVVGLIDRIVPIEDLHARALSLALTLDHPVYDCLYLALAERESAAIATADQRLADLAPRTGVGVLLVG